MFNESDLVAVAAINEDNIPSRIHKIFLTKAIWQNPPPPPPRRAHHTVRFPGNCAGVYFQVIEPRFISISLLP
jgi:hypothetical protein